MDLQEKIRTIPTEPGVYLYKNAEGEVIYVGKAKNLRSRVASYFHEGRWEDAKTGTLVREAADVEYIVVGNNKEALALENNLIKQRKPRFNILLRDDKTYPYVKLTLGERVPRVYVTRRLRHIPGLDPERIARAIEGTRFPAREGQEYDHEASILRAADFIGQLGDPNYLRKANALYYEFEEVGINRQLGYDSPADIVNRYPQFYWNSVAPHIQTEIGYLNKTEIGRQWIANLYSNVFRAELDISLSGPQK